jgi:tetratricopeptide (TPR) repeat protein
MTFNGKIKKSSSSLLVFSLLVPFSSFLIIFANATPEDDFDECAGEHANDPFCPSASSGGGGSEDDEETEEEEREREEEEEQDFDECAGENANDPFCPGAGSGGEGGGSDEEEDAKSSSDTGEDQPTTETSTLLFKHPTYDYSIQYPSNWQKDEDDEEPVDFIAPHRPGDEYSEAVIIGVDETTSLDEYVSLSNDELTLSENDFNIVESGEMTVDGNPAHKIVFTSTAEDGRKDKQMNIYIVKNGLGYEITYGGVENEYLDSLTEAQSMIDSFQLTEQATTSVEAAGQDQTTTLPSPLVTPSPAPNTESSFSILTGYQQPKPQQQPSTPSPSPSPSPTPQEPLSSTTPTTAATAQTPTQTQTQDMITYENSTLGFRVQHPSNSTITERGDIVAFSLPEPSSYLLVRVSNLTTPDMSLENYSSITFNALSESRSGFDIEQQENSTTLAGDGNPAFKIVYTDNQTNGDERKSLQTWSLIDDKSYDLTYVTDNTNFNATLPVAMQMIDSFQILGQNAVDSNVENHTGGQLNQQDIISSDVKTVYNKGVALAKSGQHEEAIKYYDKALALDPNYVNASYGKGVAHDSLGQHEEAIKYYDKALALDPNHVNALYGKGAALFNSGRYEEAILSFDKTLAIDPNYILALYYEGDSLANLGQLDVAIKYYDKVLAIDPNHVNALNKKGISLGNLEQHAEAMKYFDKVLDIEPNNIDGLYNMGVAHDSLGQHEVAIKYYDKVLAIDPNHAEALNNTKLALDEFE